MKTDKKAVTDVSIFNESRSSTYQLLGHQTHEIEEIPIRVNSLNFQQKPLNSKYLQAIYYSEEGAINKEFKLALIYFYVYLSVSQVAILLLTYINPETSEEYLLYQALSSFLLLSLAYAFLLYMHRKPELSLKSRPLLCGISILAVFLQVIGDERVFYGITGASYSDHSLVGLLSAVIFMVFLRQVLYDCFYYTVLYSGTVIVIYLSLHLVFSEESVYTAYSECFLLIVFFFVQTADSYVSDYRKKQLFFRRIREEEDSERHKALHMIEPKISHVSTNMDAIITMCEHMKVKIKAACKVVFYNEIKEILKRAMQEIELVVKTISHDTATLNVNSGTEMVKDDIAFISEFCNINCAPKTSRLRSRSLHFEVKVPIFKKEYYADAMEELLGAYGTQWNFDVTRVQAYSSKTILPIASWTYKFFSFKHELGIQESAYLRYYELLENSYQEIPFHNAVHAADVTHSFLFFMNKSRIGNKLTSDDYLLALIAVLAHDVGHPGLTSRFLINTHDDLALKYNDNSVLENMHASLAFSLMKKPGADIFAMLGMNMHTRARRIVIEMILDTDMFRHFEVLAKFKARALVLGDILLENEPDKIIVLSMALKTADEAYAAKGKDLHERWTGLMFEELFSQGDLEKTNYLPVSVHCDRDTTHIPTAVLCILKNISLPLFESWAEYLNSKAVNDQCLKQLKKNIQYWAELI